MIQKLVKTCPNFPSKMLSHNKDLLASYRFLIIVLSINKMDFRSIEGFKLLKFKVRRIFPFLYSTIKNIIIPKQKLLCVDMKAHVA